MNQGETQPLIVPLSFDGGTQLVKKGKDNEDYNINNGTNGTEKRLAKMGLQRLHEELLY